MTKVRAYTEKQITHMRNQVLREMEKTLDPNFSSFNNKDLEKVFKLNDDIFFGGQIKQKLKEENATLSFEASRKGGLGYGGKCVRRQRGPRCFYVLRFPVPLFLKLFSQGEKSLKTGGLTCSSRLMCLQITFEHELIHLLLNLWGYSRKKGALYSSHGKLFQCMLFAYFGQTEFRHSLLAGEASSLLTMADMRVGLPVKLKDMELYGVVDKINKKTVTIFGVYNGEPRGLRVAPSALEKTTKKITLPQYLKREEAKIGMKVTVNNRGQVIHGTLKRRGPSTATVLLNDGRIMGVPWIYVRKA